MVQAHWFMEIYIAIYLLIIYYHTLSYVWCYYFSRQIPWRHLIDISVKQYYVTIVLYDVIIVAPWWQPILENIDWSIWYFESVCTITEGHVTRNWPTSFEYLHLTYNKVLCLLFVREEWFGRKFWSCCLNTSTSSCWVPPYPTPWSSQTGSGKLLHSTGCADWGTTF